MNKTIISLAVLALAATASPALAKDGDDRNEVRKAGSCSPGATSKIKVKTDDGGIEAEFEVDRNHNGERWRVRFVRDGQVIAKARRKTRGRSGSFSIERHFDNLPGADTITARGVGPDGRTCTATATLPA